MTKIHCVDTVIYKHSKQRQIIKTQSMSITQDENKSRNKQNKYIKENNNKRHLTAWL